MKKQKKLQIHESIWDTITTTIKDTLSLILPSQVLSSEEIGAVNPIVETNQSIIVAQPQPVALEPVASELDLLFEDIFSLFPINTIGKLSRLNSAFNNKINHETNATIWQTKALENNLPLIPNESVQSLKQRLNAFLKEVDYIEKNYPEEVKNIFGGAQALALIPKLDSIEYINFIQKEDIKGYKIARGIDSTNMPFIVFCLKQENELILIAIAEPSMKHLVNRPWTRFIFSSSYFFPLNSINDTFCDYLGRLFRGEPCGKLTPNGEEDPKTNANNISMVRLTDQLENKDNKTIPKP